MKWGGGGEKHCWRRYTSLRAHQPRQEDQRLCLIGADQIPGDLGIVARPLVVLEKPVWQGSRLGDGVWILMSIARIELHVCVSESQPLTVQDLGGRLRVWVELCHVLLHLVGFFYSFE